MHNLVQAATEPSADVRRAFERIRDQGSLPSPKGVALRILQLSRDDAATMKTIAAAIECDPAIAARLLKVANTPLAGANRRIASIQRAVTFLGTRAVTSLALGFSLVSDNRQGSCRGFDYDLFWAESLAYGVASRHLAGRLGSFAPDEAFGCGLLGQIGRLAFAVACPESYGEVLSAWSQDSRNRLAEREVATFGIDHCAMTAEMMNGWHLPEVFCLAVRHQLHPNSGELEQGSRSLSFARILQLAGGIARVLPRPNAHTEVLSDFVVRAAGLGIPPGTYNEMFDSISREWREAGTIFAIRTRRVPPLAEIMGEAVAQQGRLGFTTDVSVESTIDAGGADVRG